MSARVGTIKLIRPNKAGAGKVVERIPVFANDSATILNDILTGTEGVSSAGLGSKRYNNATKLPADGDVNWAALRTRSN